MADDATKTASEIEAAGERLLAWAKQTSGALAVAAVFGPDPDSGGMAMQPEGLFAASLGDLSETEIAVLLAQLDVAVLTVLSRMAPHTDMGEDAFRRIVNNTRREMLAEEGLDLCDECGG